MTEAEWLAECSVQRPLLRVMARGSNRKLRLLACSACDRVREYLINPNSLAALDTLLSCPAWELGAESVDRAFRLAQEGAESIREDASEQRWYYLYEAAAIAIGLGTGPKLAECLDSVLSSCRRAKGLAAPVSGEAEVVEAEEVHQLHLLRDIFGNPFRPGTIYRAWLTTTVTTLASQVYESRDFGAMPILADALQDAGCTSDDILTHCRGDGPHVRGCWVVDLVLDKE